MFRRSFGDFHRRTLIRDRLDRSFFIELRPAGRKFSADVLHDALKAAKANTLPVELLVENTEYYKTFKLNYHEGDKYPHLVRDDAKPDLLSAILKAK